VLDPRTGKLTPPARRYRCLGPRGRLCDQGHRVLKTEVPTICILRTLHLLYISPTPPIPCQFLIPSFGKRQDVPGGCDGRHKLTGRVPRRRKGRMPLWKKPHMNIARAVANASRESGILPNSHEFGWFPQHETALITDSATRVDWGRVFKFQNWPVDVFLTIVAGSSANFEI